MMRGSPSAFCCLKADDVLEAQVGPCFIRDDEAGFIGLEENHASTSLWEHLTGVDGVGLKETSQKEKWSEIKNITEHHCCSRRVTSAFPVEVPLERSNRQGGGRLDHRQAIDICSKGEGSRGCHAACVGCCQTAAVLYFRGGALGTRNSNSRPRVVHKRREREK